MLLYELMYALYYSTTVLPLQAKSSPSVVPFLNHYEIRRTDDDSASSTARKGQQLNRNDLGLELIRLVGPHTVVRVRNQLEREAVLVLREPL